MCVFRFVPGQFDMHGIVKYVVHAGRTETYIIFERYVCARCVSRVCLSACVCVYINMNGDCARLGRLLHTHVCRPYNRQHNTHLCACGRACGLLRVVGLLRVACVVAHAFRFAPDRITDTHTHTQTPDTKHARIPRKMAHGYKPLRCDGDSVCAYA